MGTSTSVWGVVITSLVSREAAAVSPAASLPTPCRGRRNDTAGLVLESATADDPKETDCCVSPRFLDSVSEIPFSRRKNGNMYPRMLEVPATGDRREHRDGIELLPVAKALADPSTAFK